MEWFTEFLQSAAAWLDGKGFVVATSGVMSALAAWMLYYFYKVLVPKFTGHILEFIVKVVSKMFGLPADDVSDAVQQLPIVNQMDEWNKRMTLDAELKLVELKRRLVSPSLNKAERIAYQAEYDHLMESAGDKVSPKIKKVLKDIEASVDTYELG